MPAVFPVVNAYNNCTLMATYKFQAKVFFQSRSLFQIHAQTSGTPLENQPYSKNNL
jgi:hypothetical protein